MSLGSVKTADAQAAGGQNPGLILQGAQAVPNIPYENHTVYISLWLINIYSFDYRSGSYTFDFYVFFFWTDPNIATADWYLMNGYPTYSGAKLLVSANYTAPVKYEFYRVRANLNAPLQPKDYPFDTIKLDIAIELLTGGYNTTLVWLPAETGVGSDYVNLGWTQTGVELTTSVSHYPVGIESPRADMYVVEARSTYGAVVQTIVPPLIFCLVSAVCFLFPMYENTAFSLRAGVNTSILISAVLFDIAQQGNIPPVTQLTFYDVFIDSVITFLAISLIVTILGYVEWMHHRDKQRVSNLSRWGFLATVAISVILFFLLFFLK